MSDQPPPPPPPTNTQPQSNIVIPPPTTTTTNVPIITNPVVLNSQPPPPPPPSNLAPPPPPPPTSTNNTSINSGPPPPPPPTSNDSFVPPPPPPTTSTTTEPEEVETKKSKLPPKIPDSELSERDQKRQKIIRRVLLLKNPFDVLDAEPDDTEAILKKRYKKMALLIHPDKCHLERTSEAFDRLGKAMKKLEDEDLRNSFAEMIRKAREEMEKDEKTKEMTDEQKEAHRIEKVNKSLHLFEQHVTTAQKYRMANKKWDKHARFAERMKEKAIEEHQKQWDQDRDSRVGSWRDFVGGAKKKKDKLNRKSIGLAKLPTSRPQKRNADQKLQAPVQKRTHF